MPLKQRVLWSTSKAPGTPNLSARWERE